jgi:hypothetical protein
MKLHINTNSQLPVPQRQHTLQKSMIRLDVNLKPRKFTGRTKQEVIGFVIRAYCCGYQSSGGAGGLGGSGQYISALVTGHFGSDNQKVILVNYQKFRRKSKVSGKNRLVVREAHWDAWVYVIPKALVRHARQLDRNFQLVVRVG